MTQIQVLLSRQSVKVIAMRTNFRKYVAPFIFTVCVLAVAATFFDPRFQPIGSAGSYALSRAGLAGGQTKIFRPFFNDSSWWGDLESYNVDAAANIAVTPNWSAKDLLDLRTYSSRRIMSRREDTGSAVLFATLSDLSATQQAALGSQTMLDFIRGDTTNEGGIYRDRATVMGDIIHSSPVYIPYHVSDLSQDRVYVGGNDGMLHVFNAGTGVEEYAYIPSEVIGTLPTLADPTYQDSHRYFVDGEITVVDVTFSDGSAHKVLISGLGGGGQAYFALDITSTDVVTDADLTSKLLWEISDDSTGMADLGFSFSRALIAKVRDSSGTPVWAAIFGNGYGNTLADSAVGSGSAALFIVNVETGALIRKIDTLAGDSAAPNGLSSPSAEDLNNDGIIDYVYAGDLNGNVWRFDLLDASSSNWSVAFSGAPFFTAVNGQSQAQGITTPPRVLRHPDGGLLVLVGTGRILSASDVDPNIDEVQSIYGLHDRLNGTKPALNKLVVQELTESTYTDGSQVRTSTDAPVPSSTKDGWFVDLVSGERIITPLKIRSGRVLFSSTNPTISGGEIWTNEIRYLTGGAPTGVIYDMNSDGVLDGSDNIDSNADGDTLDAVDRITGLYQGGGIVVSSATLATVSATTGTFFVNRILHAVSPPPLLIDPGVIGGHFDVDTSSFIAPVDSGTTDAHVHQYDDKYNTTGVDYLAFAEAKLHEINEDILDVNQKFKLIVLNADRSNGGRLVINKTYNELDPSTYTGVTLYDDTPPASQTVYSLGGVAGSTQLAQFGLYFDKNAILDKGLIPTQTGCVKSNIRSSLGDWRNGALTVWAVAVNADGTDAFTLTYDATDPTRIVGITSGLLWESTLFWHWKGPCAHEYTNLTDAFVDPDTGATTTVWDYYVALTIADTKKQEKKKDKDKKKKKKRKDHHHEEDEDVPPDTGGNAGNTPTATTQTIAVTNSPIGALSTPDRASWSELSR